LAVVLSKKARARAVQLPAWNEALGLPRPWDQQWSLRMQQIVALETDLLEFDDLFDGSSAVEAKVEALKAEARDELARIDAMGGALEAVELGYMKQKLVESSAARLAAITRGEQIVVGVNKYEEAEPSPLVAGVDGGFMAVDAEAESQQIARLEAHRAARDPQAVEAALADLAAAAKEGRNVMEPSIACAHAGVTTGEWGETLRRIFGEYRAPTGVAGVTSRQAAHTLDPVRARVEEVSAKLGRRIKMLVGKPGLDGHSNGAEQIAVTARDCGMAIDYAGIRLTPEEIVRAAAEGAHVLGLSILSGSHMALVEETMRRLREAGLGHLPVIVGGIIPDADARRLGAMGVARVYTPKDFALNAIMMEIVELADPAPRGVAAQ
jgi:(2R)-ethylmalonyl-CoA mutase